MFHTPQITPNLAHGLPTPAPLNLAREARAELARSIRSLKSALLDAERVASFEDADLGIAAKMMLPEALIRAEMAVATLKSAQGFAARLPEWVAK